MLFLSDSSEMVRHLAAAVLLYCRELRRAGLSVPFEVGQLRDSLHLAASSGPDAAPLADLGSVAEPIHSRLRRLQ
jgi:hypothetical protein